MTEKQKNNKALPTLTTVCTIISTIVMIYLNFSFHDWLTSNHLLITLISLVLLIGGISYVAYLNSVIKNYKIETDKKLIEHEGLIDTWRTTLKEHLKKHK